LFEGEGGEPPTAPSVVIINFSIGDVSRPFARFISPLARLLDWLAYKYNVLFVVSAGNHPLPLQLACQRAAITALPAENLRRQVLEALWKQAHLRRLLAPAEAVNALTVGSEHADAAGSYVAGDRLDPLSTADGHRLLSPISALGTGVGRAVKPEVLFPGGRQLYEVELGDGRGAATLRPRVMTARPPGQMVAARGPRPGSTSATRYVCGTSNAAALAARTAARLCEQLTDLVEGPGPLDCPKRRCLVPLLKAFLVHSARWSAARESLGRLLPSLEDRGAVKAALVRLLGYGFVEVDRLFGCTDQRVTLVGWGELRDGRAHVYRVPLPTSLSGQPVKRRLTVTLAWLTPVNPRDRRYRRAQLWVASETPGESSVERVLGVSRREVDQHTSRRGTVQHEILEGEGSIAFDEEANLALQVNCREHAGALSDAIPYGLLVTLEVAEPVDLPIYEEVRARLRARVVVEP
jgi:hypothetical protein